MPLSETNKAQSKSIEDLIAQLDKPESGLKENDLPPPSSSSSSSAVGKDNKSENNNNRKVIRGKRSSNSTSESHGGSSFYKTNSFGINSEPILANNIISSKKYTKHSRGAFRGQAKKGGGGGKHTWGKPGCELEAEYALDSKDPNYDSDEASNVVMVCVENNSGQESGNDSKVKNCTVDGHDDSDGLKELDIEDLESEIKVVILEYFENGITMEVVDHLKCYNYFKIKSFLLSYCIQIALEHNNTCKELMSRLLRDLKLELFNEDDFNKAFDNLLRNLPDITLDNPNANKTVGTFLARAIADKVKLLFLNFGLFKNELNLIFV
jgi:hypothetical protein